MDRVARLTTPPGAASRDSPRPASGGLTPRQSARAEACRGGLSLREETPSLGLCELREWARRLSAVDRDVDDATRIDQLRALEELKSAAAAAQARIALDLDTSARVRDKVNGLPVKEQGKGVAAQVALARRDSPHAGGRHLGLARALSEMPHTAAALASGVISEWRATLLVRETACLSIEHRAAVDSEVAGDPARLERLGDRGVARCARAVAARLDAGALAARARRAESERAVTLRPAPDTMTYLTALLPVKDGVAAYAALSAAAATARAEADGRTRGQVMADTLVARVTGREESAPVPLHVGLVMTDRALLVGDGEPAVVEGYGPVPAPVARSWLRPRSGQRDADADADAAAGAGAGADADADADAARVWLRRLFTHPRTGQLVQLDARARLFPPGLRRFLVARDQTCRTPWCDAPIRHQDHVAPSATGGATDAANGQGLCEACNYVKEAPGWSARVMPDADPGDHVVELQTPTGHRYRSHAPPLPGAAAWSERFVAEQAHRTMPGDGPPAASRTQPTAWTERAPASEPGPGTARPPMSEPTKEPSVVELPDWLVVECDLPEHGRAA